MANAQQPPNAQYVFPFAESGFKDVDTGMRRRIFCGNDLMLCFWRIADGCGPTPYAGHPNNEQFGVIMAGQLDFRIGSEQRHLLKPGDVYWAPTNFPHGDSRFVGDPSHGETWIIDIFSPPREDYRDG
jgi:hypothetical protein